MVKSKSFHGSVATVEKENYNIREMNWFSSLYATR